MSSKINDDVSDHYLHLQKTFWMVHKVCVLHLIKDITLCLSLFVKILLINVTLHTPYNPSNRVILADKVCGFFIFLQFVLDSMEVVVG